MFQQRPVQLFLQILSKICRPLLTRLYQISMVLLILLKAVDDGKFVNLTFVGQQWFQLKQSVLQTKSTRAEWVVEFHENCFTQYFLCHLTNVL